MKLFFKLFFLALVAGAGALGGAWWYVQQAPQLAADEVDFSVPRGASLRQAMQALATAGIDVEPEVLYWAARAGSQGRHVVAGSYVATRGETRWQLVDKMLCGDVARVQVHEDVQIGVRQVHPSLHHQAQSAVQTPLRQQPLAGAHGLKVPLARQGLQCARVQLAPDAMAGQQGLQAGAEIGGRRHDGKGPCWL